MNIVWIIEGLVGWGCVYWPQMSAVLICLLATDVCSAYLLDCHSICTTRLRVYYGAKPPIQAYFSDPKILSIPLRKEFCPSLLVLSTSTCNYRSLPSNRCSSHSRLLLRGRRWISSCSPLVSMRGTFLSSWGWSKIESMDSYRWTIIIWLLQSLSHAFLIPFPPISHPFPISLPPLSHLFSTHFPPFFHTFTTPILPLSHLFLTLFPSLYHPFLTFLPPISHTFLNSPDV